ncbi:MAG: aminotransferase class V-fold PLP-dependent enzyme, partial [Lachnospirales bacterium]
IIDAAQSGGIIPIDLAKTNVDVCCFTGHKGLLGPQGTGGICVRNNVKIRPLKVGGSGIHSFSKTHPDKMPEALEAGTLNGCGIAALGSGIDYILNEGIEKIYEKELRLLEYFYNNIKNIKNITLYGDFSVKKVPIISLNIGDFDSSKVSDILNVKYNIATRAGIHCAPLIHNVLGTKNRGAVRFSFSYNNTFEEIDTAISALYDISKL